MKEIYPEFTVDVVEFVFIFTIVFVKMFLIYFFEIVKIVRTFRIDTFMYNKVLPVLLGN